MFTVVIQKGWKPMAGNEGEKKKAKEKENISILSARTVSTGGCRHCCHGYKITNTYEGSDSSHRHLKKHGLFSGRLKIQTVSKARGQDPARRSPWNHGRDMTEKRTCTVVLCGSTWSHKTRVQNERLCNNRETPHGQKMTYTGQNNRANFKHTKFTIIHIRWFCFCFFFSPLVWHFIGTNLCSKRLNVVQKVSCLINITRRI